MCKVDKIKIGVFDSGVGGFSILREIIKIIPYAEIFYIADDAFAPYGNKTDQEVINRSFISTEELINLKCDIIVVACNTATAVAIEKLRKRYKGIPFVGVEPFINVLNHLEFKLNDVHLAVITTTITGKSLKFKKLKEKLDPENTILHIMSSNLAYIIEESFQKKNSDNLKDLVKQELDSLVNQNVTHLILGCTHYSLIDKMIDNLINVKTISPCQYVAKQTKKLLNENIKDHVGKNYICDIFNFKSTRQEKWNTLSFEYLNKLFEQPE